MRTGLKSAVIILAFMLVVVAIGGARAESAAISFDPAEVDELSAGEQFTVDLVIADISNLYGWQVNVTFNPSVLNVVGATEGPFLKNVNDTMMPKTINNNLGLMLIAATFVPPYPSAGATGSGVLANVTFAVESSGGSTLHFDETSTYFRTVQEGVPPVLVPIEGVVKHDATYGGGQGGGDLGGVPWEIIGGVIAVVAVVAVVGIFFLRRRREKEEGVVR